MLEDSELVERAQQGDASAFNQLVERHYDKVFGQAMRMMKKEEEAKDIAQMAWIKAWQKLKRFRGDSAFTSWIYRITTFAAIDAIRKRDSRREISAEEDFLDYANPSEGSAVAPPAQIRMLEQKELRDHFMGAIENLPDSQRETMMLREIEGLPYDAIADRMGCKIGTVMSRLFNARKTVQKQLADFLK